MRTEQWKERWHELKEKILHPLGGHHEESEWKSDAEKREEERRQEERRGHAEPKIDKNAGSE